MRPINKRFNEAIKIHLNQRGSKQASLEVNLASLQKYGKSDPGVQIAIAARVNAEASLKDPLEGNPVEGRFIERQLQPAGQCKARSASFSVPDRDEDSSQLRENLGHTLQQIIPIAECREASTPLAARHWQSRMMEDLDVPDRQYGSAFRGESSPDRHRYGNALITAKREANSKVVSMALRSA